MRCTTLRHPPAKASAGKSAEVFCCEPPAHWRSVAGPKTDVVRSSDLLHCHVFPANSLGVGRKFALRGRGPPRRRCLDQASRRAMRWPWRSPQTCWQQPPRIWRCRNRSSARSGWRGDPRVGTRGQLRALRVPSVLPDGMVRRPHRTDRRPAISIPFPPRCGSGQNGSLRPASA